MEQADTTLHDFVLNLLSDSHALASFEQDPAAVLDHAGLGDISAADVQEVIPLVIDFVPSHAEALDAALSQLPLDSVGAGQLGAIQQLQFVTQALGGIPAFESDGSVFSGQGTAAAWQLASDGHTMVGTANFVTPMSDGGATFSADAQHGMTGGLWEHSALGDVHANMALPGLDSLPGVGSLPGLGSLPGVGSLPGLESLPGLNSLPGLSGGLPGLSGGLPSGFSALSDVTDALDGHLNSAAGMMSENATNAANLLAGAAGGLTNPAELTSALANPAAAFNALSGSAESLAASGAHSLPAPADAVASQVMQTTASATHGVVSEVTSHLPAGGLGSVGNLANLGNLGGLGSHLPSLTDPTHALSTVQGVVGEVTGGLTSNLPTGALGDLGHLPAVDPTHALGAVQSVVGEVASHSAVADVTGSTGAGNLLGTLDHTDVGSTLSHATSDLHLPSLF
ncbi:MAG TPA: IniB N-terminal domain-containing protein [Pseudonocardiaceae bacterium]|jgi:hypothetical protein|nr:IniB N-terminal domain-containing protein [Pseudonocardiaceae bacterium]